MSATVQTSFEEPTIASKYSLFSDLESQPQLGPDFLNFRLPDPPQQKQPEISSSPQSFFRRLGRSRQLTPRSSTPDSKYSAPALSIGGSTPSNTSPNSSIYGDPIPRSHNHLPLEVRRNYAQPSSYDGSSSSPESAGTPVSPIGAISFNWEDSSRRVDISSLGGEIGTFSGFDGYRSSASSVAPRAFAVTNGTAIPSALSDGVESPSKTAASSIYSPRSGNVNRASRVIHPNEIHSSQEADIVGTAPAKEPLLPEMTWTSEFGGECYFPSNGEVEYFDYRHNYGRVVELTELAHPASLGTFPKRYFPSLSAAARREAPSRATRIRTWFHKKVQSVMSNSSQIENAGSNSDINGSSRIDDSPMFNGRPSFHGGPSIDAISSIDGNSSIAGTPSIDVSASIDGSARSVVPMFDKKRQAELYAVFDDAQEAANKVREKRAAENTFKNRLARSKAKSLSRVKSFFTLSNASKSAVSETRVAESRFPLG